jgi:hypothetical protein
MKTFSGVVLLAAVCVTLASAPGFAQDDAPEKGKRFQACKADREKFCADVPRGEHKTRPCLEANKDKLSAECKAALEAPRENK